MTPTETLPVINRSYLDEADEGTTAYTHETGINEEVVQLISKSKNEPEWMLNIRLKALALFLKTPTPQWGPSLKNIDFNKITYFSQPKAEKNATKWEDVPENIKKTFDKLGIPEAEQKYLSGVGAQYDSEVVYHSLQKELQEQGVIFIDMDEAVQHYPEIVQKYFMKRCIPIHDHKLIMLHAAVWSGGTFIYIPKNVKVKTPLQAYFRMNAKRGGQFEHTLIIADEGSEISYIEGCSSPVYTENSLHAGCVELFIHKNARMRYSSVENWSKNTYNLNTKRAIVEENGIIEWIGGNMGSSVTMLYPSSILVGKNSRADHLGIAYAGKGQHQDTGSKVILIGENTSCKINSKSISKEGGICSYRGIVVVNKGAKNAKVSVNCDGLMMDAQSQSNTFPVLKVNEKNVHIAHEAKVGKISQQDLFYLMSRGLTEEQAISLIVSGFIEPVIKELPLEYAVEMNKLIELEMTNALG
ncbi:Fe-S cluster assembly protein SufB [Candidatus Woesearchaeota archaeon]|nr:Fe-S cluster assembly protein SufB [Candidatus Woesearchaeota archaeon]